MVVLEKGKRECFVSFLVQQLKGKVKVERTKY